MWLVFGLTGCAGSPFSGEGKAKSDALLAQQFVAASQTVATAAPNGRILFAGFAAHSQSKAFRRDVELVEKMLRSLDANAVVFKLDNPASGNPDDWPFATFENMDRVIQRLAILASPQDKMVVLISTHGNVGALGINFKGKDYPSINAKTLNRTLTALKQQPALFLLSACHSGSFVPALEQPHRIVMAAAAADRASFGCNFESTNTYFIDALFNQADWQNQSILQLMDSALLSIAQREKDMGLSPPSNPKISVGTAAVPWASSKIKDWFTPAALPKP